MQEESISKHINAVMDHLRIGITSGNRETPDRVARFLMEFNQPCDLKGLLKSFVHEDDKDGGLVILNDLQVGALCEHHWCPFFGKAFIGYIPGECVVGLSKMQRLVSAACRL